MIDFDDLRSMGFKVENDLINPSTPTSTPTSSKNQLITDNDKIIRLIEIIANNHLSVKEMMAAIGLRDRENFMEYSLTPAIKLKRGSLLCYIRANLVTRVKNICLPLKA